MINFFRNTLLLLLMLFAFTASAQEEVEMVRSLKLQANWNNEDLSPGGSEIFNDIWGWVDSQGREFVIMGSYDSIYFFDITDPEKPVLCDVEAGKAPGCIHRDFKTYLNYCYAVADENNSSLQIFDLSYLPDSVHKVYDSNQFSIQTHNIFVENSRLYLADNATPTGYAPMAVLSLDDPVNPVLISRLKPPVVGGDPLFSEVHDVFVENDTAYCSVGDDGFMIYDYRDPVNPKLITDLQIYPDQGYNHSSWRAANSKLLIMADETHHTRLKLFDASDPTDLKLKSLLGYNWNEGSIPHNPFIRDEYLYISYYHEGVVVFDISNPEEPEFIDAYDTYPQNTGYGGMLGCWGIYPFFPSGIIAASDLENGLFLLKLDTLYYTPSKEEFPDAILSPNPFIDHFSLVFELSVDQQMQMSMHTLLGQELFSLERRFPSGENRWKVGTRQFLYPGMYILTLSGEEFTKSFRILKAD
ncbi:MAG: choice-of-anchor B family protein [Bacteroidia bacterium]